MCMVNCMGIITVHFATAYFPLRILLFRMIRYPTLSALASVVAKWSAISVCKVTGTVTINRTEAEQTAVLIKGCNYISISQGKKVANVGNSVSSFRIFIIVIIIIIFIIISFMQGIYTYIPETNYVPREYSVAAILLLLFMVLISLVSVLNLLQFYISTFRSVCAVPNVAVFCS